MVGLVTAPTVAVAFDSWQDAKEEEVRARLAAAMDSPSGGNPNANNGPPNSFGEYGRPDPSHSGDDASDDSSRDPTSPSTTPSRPDSLPDHLSHQGDGGTVSTPAPAPTRPDSLPAHLLLVPMLQRGNAAVHLYPTVV